MGDSLIPTVDLSPFFRGDEVGKKKATEIIGEACSNYGFFQVVNHGIPLKLMSRAMELSKTFFAYPEEEKHKSLPQPDAPRPAGYCNVPGKVEDLFICTPGTSYNVFPTNPPDLKNVIEEFFSYFAKTGHLVESIVNDCLGLPPNFLQKYNNDRSWDVMLVFHYHPTTETDTIGAYEHQDVNNITFVFQDDVGGLEVQKDGEWIRVTPTEGALVVNVGDIIQVLTNNKFKSGVHRVVSPEGKSRHSFAFFYHLEGEKWVEPLSQFTKEIGEKPKYSGFRYKEYYHLRLGQKAEPPKTVQDRIRITRYALPA